MRPVLRAQPAMRLFCFAHAGGGVAAFRGWADALAAHCEVICLQPPGRESRIGEAPLTSLTRLAHASAAAIAPLLDRPYACFGQSLGGLVAFETLRELGRRSAPPAQHLFVAAARAPQLPLTHPPVRSLDDVTLLREVTRRYGGTVPAPVLDSPELRALLVPALRGDLAALETYRHEPGDPLACGITAFVGRSDAMVSRDDVDAWRCHTSSTFELREVDGGHLLLPSAGEPLLAAVKTTLAAAVARGTQYVNEALIS